MNTSPGRLLARIAIKGNGLPSVLAVTLVLAWFVPAGQAQVSSWVRLKNDQFAPGADGYLTENPTQPGKVSVEKASWCDPYAQWALVPATDGSGQITIQNRATGDRMNLADQKGYVQCDQSHPATDPTARWTQVTPSPRAGDFLRLQNVGQPGQAIQVQAGMPYALAAPATAAGLLFRAEPVVGATVPYIEYEAENGTFSGTLLGPDATFGQPESEASGREAVRLSNTGDYVQWTAKAGANAITVRYCIPDSTTADANGVWGIQAALDLYVNGSAQPVALPVSSRLSWLYGSDDSPTETPGDLPHHFYDEVSLLLPVPIQAGQTIRLQKDAANTAGYYIIDLIDLEAVPAPLPQPANTVSLASTGGQPGGTFDNASALANAIATAKAQGESVWIPTGVWGQGTPVKTDGVSIYGAGIWYSQLVATAPAAQGNGPGFQVTSGTTVSDLAIFGNVSERGVGSPGVSQELGAGGCNNVTIKDVWFEHNTVGVGLGQTNVAPVNLVVSDCRVRDSLADGVHIFRSPQGCTIINTTARSTGDDSLNYLTVGAGSNSIVNCTVQAPWRADCYAFYGGNGNLLSACEGYDTAVHAGINASLQFNALSFGPATTNIQDVNLYRCGGRAYNGRGQYQQTEGAVWVDANTGSIAPAAGNVPAIRFSRVNVYEPVDLGLHLQSENGYTQSGVVFGNVNVDHSAGDGVYINPGTAGSGEFDYVSIYQAAGQTIDNASPGAYTLAGASDPGSSLIYPAFFTGQVALAQGVYYLALPGGGDFSYYTFLSDPNFLYHFDLGYEYVFSADDDAHGVYLYDFTSNDYFYTSPTFPFPYLYDFGLQTFLYYYPDPQNPSRYNTNGVRYFYNFATGKIITK